MKIITNGKTSFEAEGIKLINNKKYSMELYVSAGEDDITVTTHITSVSKKSDKIKYWCHIVIEDDINRFEKVSVIGKKLYANAENLVNYFTSNELKGQTYSTVRIEWTLEINDKLNGHGCIYHFNDGINQKHIYDVNENFTCYKMREEKEMYSEINKEELEEKAEKEEHEEMVENITPETSPVQAPAQAPVAKKFTTHTGKKVTGTLIEQWNNGEHSAAKLYDMGNNKELLIAIYTRPNTMVSAEIILDQQLNAILKLIKHPEKISDTQIEKIIVRYYEKGQKDISILRMEINDSEIHYNWSQNLKVDMYTAEAWDKNSEYIFYNKKRVMFTAWNLRKSYLKQGKNIPLSFCIKYAVGQERFYQGIYSSFEDATKEPSKPILDILHQKSEPVPEKRQERTITYSIPYRLFKSSEKGGLYELVSYFGGAIEETDRNYNKSTKEMELTFKITSDTYKEARRFSYDEDTFNIVVSSNKICFLNHYKEELKKHGMDLTNHLLTNDTESRKEYAEHKLETGKITKETYEWFMSFHDGLLIPVLN